ncbi:hypothetical protein GCM10010409_12080 [Mycolicibacterium diernhoferi]
MGEIMEVRDAADDGSQVHDMGASFDNRLGLAERKQISGVHFTPVKHPLRCRTLIRHSDGAGIVAQQSSDHGTADRADAAGDENSVHLKKALSAGGPKPVPRLSKSDP